MSYIIEELENISAVAYHDMDNMESITVGIWVRTGSRYENNEKAGISHFLEHLVFRGTKNFTANQITRSIEGVGGTLNAFTSREYTCYLVKVRKRFLDLAFQVLSDMVLYPTLSLEDIRREKKIIIEEIKMYLDIPMRNIYDLLNSILWENHSLGRLVSGSTDTVNAISKEDINNYKTACYTSSNLIVVACGAVSRGELIRLINRYFPDTPSGEKNQFVIFDKRQTAPQIKLENRNTQQTHIALGSKAPSRNHSQSFALSLLNVILGGNMSSRLFNEIREKRGLAYGINSRIVRFIDQGAFIIYAGIECDNLYKVLKIIIDQLKEIKGNPPSKDELKRAKEYYKGQLLLSLEDTMENMLWFGERIVTESEITSPKRLLKEIDKVTIEEISELASDIFNANNINLSVIGPNLKKKDDKILNILEKI